VHRNDSIYTKVAGKVKTRKLKQPEGEQAEKERQEREGGEKITFNAEKNHPAEGGRGADKKRQRADRKQVGGVNGDGGAGKDAQVSLLERR